MLTIATMIEDEISLYEQKARGRKGAFHYFYVPGHGLQQPAREVSNSETSRDNIVQYYLRDFYWLPHIDRLPEFAQPQMFDVILHDGLHAMTDILHFTLTAILGNHYDQPALYENHLTDTEIGFVRAAMQKVGAKFFNNRMVESRLTYYKSLYKNDALSLRKAQARATRFMS